MKILKERYWPMKPRLNNSGRGAYELLSVAFVCLLVSCILLVTILSHVDSEKYQVFCYNAKIMALNAVNVRNNTNQKNIYLYQMIQDGLISPIKNPFSGDDYCNIYESKVSFNGDKRSVNLQCGSYVISSSDIGDNSYSIYEVSSWVQGTRDGEVDKKTVYNIMEDKTYLLDGFYEEELALDLFNEKYHQEFTSIKEVEKEYEVVSKEVFRSKKFVKEIEY